MSLYRRILVVVDLTEDSLVIGRRAQALATTFGADIELLREAILRRHRELIGAAAAAATPVE